MGNVEKATQLGMPYGTASHRLRKLVLYALLVRHGENICYRCNQSIETVDELSMDHKEPWFLVSNALFWDVENIAFAHLSCNAKAGRRRTPEHGHRSTYSKHSCRCESCTEAYRQSWRDYRQRRKTRRIV